MKIPQKSKLIVTLIVLISGLIFAVPLYTLITIEFYRELNFLEYIQNLDSSEIKEIEIHYREKFESKEKILEISDPEEISDLIICINQTENWEPNHPISQQDFDLVLYLKNGDIHSFELNTLKSGGGIIYIWYSGENFNGTFQNKKLYNWLLYKRLIKGWTE